ncbi:WhiB family transcriptional regulator [Glycomyces tarimensis]
MSNPTDFLESLDSPDWFADARCTDPRINPDVFFPVPGQTVRAAKAICAVCPVKRRCLEYALGDTSLRGVWGGMSERERRAERRWRGVRAPHKRFCANRHPLADDSSFYVRPDGRRECLKCHVARGKERTEQRRFERSTAVASA